MTDRIWTAEEIEAAAARFEEEWRDGGLRQPIGPISDMLRQQAARIKELEAQVRDWTEACEASDKALVNTKHKLTALQQHAEAMAEALENLGGHLRGLSKQGTIGMHYSDEAYTALAAYRKWREGQDERP